MNDGAAKTRFISAAVIMINDLYSLAYLILELQRKSMLVDALAIVNSREAHDMA